MLKKSMKIIADFIEDIQNKDEEDNIYHIFEDIFKADFELNKVYQNRGCEARVNFNSLNEKEIKRKNISSKILNNPRNIAIVGDYFYKILSEIDQAYLDDFDKHYDEFGTFFHYLSEYNKELYDYMDAERYVDEFFGIDIEELEASHS